MIHLMVRIWNINLVHTVCNKVIHIYNMFTFVVIYIGLSITSAEVVLLTAFGAEANWSQQQRVCYHNRSFNS